MQQQNTTVPKPRFSLKERSKVVVDFGAPAIGKRPRSRRKREVQLLNRYDRRSHFDLLHLCGLTTARPKDAYLQLMKASMPRRLYDRSVDCAGSYLPSQRKSLENSEYSR